MQAGLEYEDGSYANADTGMWLHHVVLFNSEKKDTLCPENLPERFFASGNERTEANLCANGYDFPFPHFIIIIFEKRKDV